jgi:hypothetical protein
LSVTAVWELPEELEQPEGLCVGDDMIPLVAIDSQSRGGNIFVLDALD